MAFSADRDEWVDVLHASGFKTGNQRKKSEAHRLGLWHATVHVWICDPLNGLLCQQRDSRKAINGGLWDFSAAGHVGAGETLVHSAQRELAEETGLNFPIDSLNYLGVHVSKRVYGQDFRDFEFNHLFGYSGPINEEELKPQFEEVSVLKFLSSGELQRQWEQEPELWVGHSKQYYSRLLEFVKNAESSF